MIYKNNNKSSYKLKFSLNPIGFIDRGNYEFLIQSIQFLFDSSINFIPPNFISISAQV